MNNKKISIDEIESIKIPAKDILGIADDYKKYGSKQKDILFPIFTYKLKLKKANNKGKYVLELKGNILEYHFKKLIKEVLK